ncbi:MAG: two-component regulator propeller domain-containing protein [Pyrinomonadaceae bacterium]
MRTGRKLSIAAAILVSLALFVFSNFLGQSQSPTPSTSPSPSPTATPAKAQTPRPTPTPLPGAQNFHQWGAITIFNGLPSDSVRAISQTPDGVMWFGTENGLARFDGRRIQNFSLGSTDSDRILVLKTTSTGELWIGTANGAFIYSDYAFQPVEGTQNMAINAIAFGQSVFLGTNFGTVLRVEVAATLKAAVFNPTAIISVDGTPDAITSLVMSGGKLLAGTAGRGVFVVTESGSTEFPSSTKPLFVNSLAASEAGVLWFGSDAAKGASGVYELGGGSAAKRITAATANVQVLEANGSGLWAGTERYGLFHFSPTKPTKTYTFENTSGGLRSDTIFSIFTDREGVLWIGTNRGVSRFDRLGPFQETVSDVPNSNFIRSVFRAREDWSLAGSNRGLFLSEGKAWKRVPGFDEKVIYAIGEHINTTLLIGTSMGLFDFSGKLVTAGDTRAIANSKFGTYAAVFGRGVVQIRAGSRGFGLPDPAESSPPVISSDVTTTTVATGTDKLWIGTAGNGLFSFDGRSVKLETGPDILKCGTIWRIFEDSSRGLWIAGQHGIFHVRDGQPEKVIDVEDVRDLLVDGEQVWATTTTRGLLHMRRHERFGWLVSSVGFEQGLPSEKAFVIRPYGEDLTIGTNRGLVRYRPGATPPKLLPVRILSQREHGLAELRRGIDLEYPQNSILVEVAGQSSRTFPEEFQYAFVLKNSNDEVVDQRLSNDPQYAPTDLKPGSYTIESRAFDRDLLESEPLFIHFSVGKAPFPWTATALGVLLAIALIALIWAVIERRRISLRNKELAAARFDLANEAERERSRIARDLHDQTLADLRNLMMMSDRIVPDNPEFRSEIESVSTEIRRICEDLSPSVLENVGLVSALEFLLSRSFPESTFTASDDTNDRVKFPVIEQLHIYRIAQEILSNIKRHSDATAVEMSVQIGDDERFLMAIKDNGTAFDPNNASGKGRGISNIRSRASLINAEIGWKESSQGGNIFELEIAGKIVE